MARIGYICDGCGDEYNHRDPAAAVQDSELNWLELCSGCYDEWDAGSRQEVLQS